MVMPVSSLANNSEIFEVLSVTAVCVFIARQCALRERSLCSFREKLERSRLVDHGCCASLLLRIGSQNRFSFAGVAVEIATFRRNKKNRQAVVLRYMDEDAWKISKFLHSYIEMHFSNTLLAAHASCPPSALTL